MPKKLKKGIHKIKKSVKKSESTDTPKSNTDEVLNLDILKKLSWQKWSLIAIILFVFILQFNMFSKFEHLPGPMYGGDLYREKGFSLHFMNTGEFWSDPFFLGESAFWPSMGYVVAGGIAEITGADIETVLIYLPILTTILISLTIFWFGMIMFKDESYALGLVLLNAIIYNFVIYKHTYAIGYILLFLFAGMFLKLQQESTLKRKILAGVLLGSLPHFHHKPFLFVVLIVTVFLIHEFISRWRSGEKISFLIRSFIKKYWLMFFIGISISLIFFGPLIFKYHMANPNPVNKYSLFDADSNGFKWVWGRTTFVIPRFASITSFTLGVIYLSGFLYCILNFRKLGAKFGLLSYIALIIGTGHYLITKPLFDFWVIPGHISEGLLIPKLIFFSYGLKFIVGSLHLTLEKKYPKLNLNFMKMISIILVTLFLIGPTFLSGYESYKKDQWVQYGMKTDPGTQVLFEIGDWLQDNVENDESILANDESAFMLTAMSGKKVVASRRVHASSYADVDEKYADAIIMFFGENEEIQKELIKKHKVKYVYLDQFLMNYPMLVSPRFAEKLYENGIEFTQENVRLDPATATSPAYDYLVVNPQELTLTQNLNQDKLFQIGEQVHSGFFTINQEWLNS